MSEEIALLKAITAYPDDDTPRLVYADWLDDHGRSIRAAYIRMAIDFARDLHSPEETANVMSEMMAAEERLGRPHWCRPYQTAHRRGMIEEIELSTKDFLQLREEFRLTPLPFRHLRLTNYPNSFHEWRRLTEHPLLSRLETLGFLHSQPRPGTTEYYENFNLMTSYPSNHPNDREAERNVLSLVYEPALKRLRSLQLPGSAAGPVMQEIMVARGHGLNVLPSLVELSGYTELPAFTMEASYADKEEARWRAQHFNSHWQEKERS